MKTKKYWILAVVVTCVSVLLSMNVLGISYWEKFQLESYDFSTLQSIKAINPKVQVCWVGQGKFFGKKEEFENKLQNQVELVLKQSGIKVASASKETQLLNVTIIVTRITIPAEVLHPSLHNEKVDAYAYRLTVGLYQLANLNRNPKIASFLRTWPMTSVVGSLPMSFSQTVIREQIQEELSDQITAFCNDYLAANPKEAKNHLEDLIKPENQASQEIVFTGIPQIKILIENGSQGKPERLSKVKSIEYKCTVTKVNNKYYWTTRENVELIAKRSGIYTTFFATNGAGYVRIIEPEMKKIVFKEGEQLYDYIEHMTLGLSTISYYGVSK